MRVFLFWTKMVLWSVVLVLVMLFAWHYVHPIARLVKASYASIQQMWRGSQTVVTRGPTKGPKSQEPSAGVQEGKADPSSSHGAKLLASLTPLLSGPVLPPPPPPPTPKFDPDTLAIQLHTLLHSGESNETSLRAKVAEVLRGGMSESAFDTLPDRQKQRLSPDKQRQLNEAYRRKYGVTFDTAFAQLTKRIRS